ncbi:hypothetical protein DN748_04245 [Sinomicrobium soli]|nr:hypothetical protein DN748_04245 [Sinomicrobium sp. N-1-3-6]
MLLKFLCSWIGILRFATHDVSILSYSISKTPLFRRRGVGSYAGRGVLTGLNFGVYTQTFGIILMIRAFKTLRLIKDEPPPFV